MVWIRAKEASKSGLNRMISSTLRVRLVSDVPERMALWPGPTLIDAKRRRMIEAIRKRGILIITTFIIIITIINVTIIVSSLFVSTIIVAIIITVIILSLSLSVSFINVITSLHKY